MNKKLQSLLNRSNKQVDFYMDLADKLSPAQLEFKFNDKEWSILQLLEHLYQIDKITIQFMKKFDFERKNQKLGIKQDFYFLLLKIFLLSPIKFKLPSVESINPAHKHIEKDQLLKDWKHLRNEFEEFLENFPLEKRYHFIFHHPIVGKLNVAHTVGFLHDHAQHHRRQVEKIKSFKGFPKA